MLDNAHDFCISYFGLILMLSNVLLGILTYALGIMNIKWLIFHLVSGVLLFGLCTLMKNIGGFNN